MADTMTAPTIVATAAPELTHVFTSMASTVTFRIVNPAQGADAAIERAQAAVEQIARDCTRFDPGSALMRANAAGASAGRWAPRGKGRGDWVEVGQTCFDVLRAAYDAYLATDGTFDPRTLASLEALGYDRTWSRVDHEALATTSPKTKSVVGHSRPWRPAFDERTTSVKLGRRPVDLGGIGKGYAVREAARILAGSGTGVLVEAGGDLATQGCGPLGRPWRASVEDPFAGPEPVAVLDVSDAAAATSSIRLRQWVSGGRPVHHLIDPRTGQPADSGLRSVTVVGPDPAVAEVWSKSLFIHGRMAIRSVSTARDLAALWVDDAGRVQMSPAMRPRVLWSVPRVR